MPTQRGLLYWNPPLLRPLHLVYILLSKIFSSTRSLMIKNKKLICTDLVKCRTEMNDILLWGTFLMSRSVKRKYQRQVWRKHHVVYSLYKFDVVEDAGIVFEKMAKIMEKEFVMFWTVNLDHWMMGWNQTNMNDGKWKRLKRIANKLKEMGQLETAGMYGWGLKDKKILDAGFMSDLKIYQKDKKNKIEEFFKAKVKSKKVTIKRISYDIDDIVKFDFRLLKYGYSSLSMKIDFSINDEIIYQLFSPTRKAIREEMEIKILMEKVEHLFLYFHDINVYFFSRSSYYENQKAYETHNIINPRFWSRRSKNGNVKECYWRKYESSNIDDMKIYSYFSFYNALDNQTIIRKLKYAETIKNNSANTIELIRYVKLMSGVKIIQGPLAAHEPIISSTYHKIYLT
jgi:hypothetical protein